MSDEITFSLTRGESIMTMAMVAAVLEGMDRAIAEGNEMEDRALVDDLFKKLGGQFGAQDNE